MYSSEDDEICAFSQLHIKITMVETFSVQDGPDIPLRSQDLRPRRYAWLPGWGELLTSVKSVSWECQIIAATPSTPASPGIVKLQTVRQAYEQLAASSSKDSVPLDEILSSDDDSSRLEQTVKYTERLMATRDESAPGHLFINGKYAPMGGVRPPKPHLRIRWRGLLQQWTMMVQSELGAQLNMLQEQVSQPILSQADQTDRLWASIGGHLYLLLWSAIDVEPPDQAHCTWQWGEQASNLQPAWAVWGWSDKALDDRLRVLRSVVPNLGESSITKALSDNAERAAPITMWVVGDLDSPEGQVTVKNALKHLQVDCNLLRA